MLGKFLRAEPSRALPGPARPGRRTAVFCPFGALNLAVYSAFAAPFVNARLRGLRPVFRPLLASSPPRPLVLADAAHPLPPSIPVRTRVHLRLACTRIFVVGVTVPAVNMSVITFNSLYSIPDRSRSSASILFTASSFISPLSAPFPHLIPPAASV